MFLAAIVLKIGIVVCIIALISLIYYSIRNVLIGNRIDDIAIQYNVNLD